MIIPYCTDIRKIEAVGKDSYINITLADVLDFLPFDDVFKHELTELSEAYAEASLHVFTEASEDAKFEGRGRYSNHNYRSKPIILYTKGAGNMPNLIRAAEEGISDPLYGFGPNNGGEYFFDEISSSWHFPRVLGAEYSSGAAIEFLNALRVMVDLCNRHSFTSLSDLINNGVTIPISTATFGGLKDYLGMKVQDELSSIWDWEDVSGVGAVTLLVPSTERTDFQRNDDSYSLHIPIAKAIRELYEASGAVFSIDSAHSQNFYNAPYSICPISDFSDLVFDLDPETRMGLFVLAADRIHEEGLIKYGTDCEIFSSAEYLRIISCGEFEDKYFFFSRESEYLLRYIAEKIDSPGKDRFVPPDELMSMLIDPELYEAIEAKIIWDTFEHVNQSGILNVKAKIPEMPADGNSIENQQNDWVAYMFDSFKS
ncbi:hypothetical protein GQ472_05755 [archaeon]|nr:hypothetical protein [archaeon]